MYHVILNPSSKSGKSIKIWNKLEPVICKQNIDYKLHSSKGPGDITNIVNNLCNEYLSKDEESILELIALGGDGTLNEVLQGITDFSRVHIGYIPTGSSNDLARDLKLPNDPVACLNNILNCTSPLKMDLGCLQYDATSTELSQLHDSNISGKRYFDVSAGVGYDASICEEALVSPIKKALNKFGLGKLVYLFIALKQLFTTKGYTCHITLDDDIRMEIPEFMFVACMIHQYEGGGFKFAPDADYTDGIIDLCVVGNIGKFTILKALPKALKGTHFKYRGVDRHSAKKIHIETSLPCWVHTDGEVTMKSSSVTITCQKEAIMFLK